MRKPFDYAVKPSLGKGLGLAALFAILLQGCVGYQLGSMLPDDIQTVFIPTFVNNTDEPLIEIDATQAAIREIQQDGSLRVTDEDRADAILEVVLTGFSLNPLAYDGQTRTLANEYRLTLHADVTLRRTAAGTFRPSAAGLTAEERAMEEAAHNRKAMIIQGLRVSGENEFDFTSDLTTAKREALPRAAEDLAHDIIERVVEYW